MFVATAAPVTPISGKIHQPKMRQGSRMMFSVLARINVRIAITASPAPRKMALMRKIKKTVALPPSMTRVNPAPWPTTASSAPMSRRISGAKPPNTMPMPAETSTPSSTICPADCAASSGSFSPMRRETIAVAAIEMPMATA